MRTNDDFRKDTAAKILAAAMSGAMRTEVHPSQIDNFIQGLASLPSIVVDMTDQLIRELEAEEIGKEDSSKQDDS